MGYYWNIVSRFSIDIAFVMRPPQKLVGIVTVIKYNLVIVTEFRFTYPTIVRFFTRVTCFTSERIMLSLYKFVSPTIRARLSIPSLRFLLSSVHILKLRAFQIQQRSERNGQSVD